MSIIAHMLYDEAKAEAYRQEAEAIVFDAAGRTHREAQTIGDDRQYQRAVTAVVRSLTLYDLCHEPSDAPKVRNHPVKITVPRERYQLAYQEAKEKLLMK